ncbi:DNA-binding transcriptional regulator, AcrR family [Saccharopolyspora antimicrobica]|uniref:DNA-binding transcriptional regulator, AcrR family n=1 Tax=Saccharopolyspora antimicrobica TaxID=455193 RepID=A0A1I5HPQ6_9PSEU|nr:TetR/AcrR family transcriptional regulator [Saccharopolyspora antimicrobica]RKT82394.1 TetR family transcriptional regulator [Saccharopolyspora antimicrobica]SFO50272.1 DNA-binding transcriptional regulator, AcrR family [Saccharopolyspora antimicrobica]
MTSESQRGHRVRAVGRGPKVRAVVHAATLAELIEKGYAALTVDNVAQRAGVHKTTVYRRWADRESLVVDALAEHVAADIPVPDTGAVDTDLRELARSLVGTMTSPSGQAILAAMFSDAVRLPEIADARTRVFDDRFRRAEPVITRAIERGDLPADTDPEEVLRALVAPIYFRLLISAEPVDEATADHAAALALAAARAGVLRKK